MNGYFHNLTGVNMSLYVITDWLGLVPIGVAFGFAVLGLVQWIKRKSLLKVDRSILSLGGFYIVVMAVYILFEIVVINYRPTLINGYLEASYPSSTTMLVMCVMPTAMMQLRARIKNKVFKRCVIVTIAAFTAFMVIGRFVSGVHWITDIIGGVILSTGLVMLYCLVCGKYLNFIAIALKKK
jgi:undecaprenyl-diphosphatase